MISGDMERGGQHPCSSFLRSKAWALPAGLGSSTLGLALRQHQLWLQSGGTRLLSRGNPWHSAAHSPHLLAAPTLNSLTIPPLIVAFSGVGGWLESHVGLFHGQGILPGSGRVLSSDTRSGCTPNDNMPGLGDRVSCSLAGTDLGKSHSPGISRELWSCECPQRGTDCMGIG